jgi:hypothetical protein
MPLQATSGAASYDGFGGGVVAEPNYIESVFSTYLYTGNGSTQTITNGIDLSTKGGLVWIKSRSNALSHSLIDTARGQNKILFSNLTDAQTTSDPATGLTSFDTTGFSLGPSYTNGTNSNGVTNASWTFRKQPKFFDIVTYTGNGTARTVAHSLGSAPGCVIVKRTDSANDWIVWHRSGSQNNNNAAILNATDSYSTIGTGLWGAGGGTPDMNSSTISIGGNTNVNAVGGTFVAYLFAHNAGGFGLTGTDNVISCGSYTTNSSGDATINLGYEPQWVMVKRSDGAGDWYIVDSMRGNSALNGTQNTEQILKPNSSAAESSTYGIANPTSTGFQAKDWGAVLTFIYIAIRRGPMKVPTSGTSVFNTALRTTGNPNFVAGFPIDMSIYALRSGAAGTPLNISRLTNTILVTSNTSAETANDPSLNYDQQLGYGSGQSTNSNVLSWMWKRAPSFFDEVCVTPSYPTPVTHNLGAVPKLRFEKTRSITAEWKAIYFDGTTDEYELALNSTRAASLQSGRPGLPTSTSFIAYYDGTPIVAYLFAPVPGVQYISKFTGNGSSQTINCGFTGGARFICIKAFSTTGDWKVIDTARGIVSGNDPTLAFNTTSAEVTGTDCIDPDSSGFIVNQESTNNLNVNGVEYLVWAIA